MDNIDNRILSLLKGNARMSASQIGKCVHLSVPAVSERIRKLEQAEIITGYTVQINHQKLGKALIAIIYVGFETSNDSSDFLEFVRDDKEIQECYFIAGDFDYALKIITNDTISLGKMINRIKRFDGINKTRTVIVLDTVKEDFYPEIGGIV